MVRTIYKAKYIHPVIGSIIENGAILVDKGKIIQLGKGTFFDQEAFDDCEIVDYSQGMILPGFVNIHTHLEYALLGKLPVKTLVEFLWQTINQTSNWTESKVRESVKLGIKQCLDYGVTTIGDVSRWGISPLVLSEYPILANVALEAFSYDYNSSEAVFKKLKDKLNYLQTRISGNVTLSVSPHSTYNSYSRLWELLIDYTKMNNMLIYAHIAESLEEKNWFEFGCSDIDKLHKLIGWPKVTPDITSLSPIEYLSSLELISSNLIAVHLCYASARDLELLEDKNVSVVICPRSNLNLSKKILEYSILNSIKIKPIIATDATTSTGSLNILEDVRLYNSKNNISPDELLKMITIYPAKALNLDKQIGSLEESKLANFVVFDQIDTPDNWFNCLKPSNVYIEGLSAFEKITKNT